MPGPRAAQLAIYLGYVHHGSLGATTVGVAFILPSFLLVIALGRAYLHFGGIRWVPEVPKVIVLIATVSVRTKFKEIPEPIVMFVASNHLESLALATKPSSFAYNSR